MAQPNTAKRFESLLRSSAKSYPHNLAPRRFTPRHASSSSSSSSLTPATPSASSSSTSPWSPSVLHPITRNPAFSNPATHSHISHPHRIFSPIKDESQRPELLDADMDKIKSQIVETLTGMDRDTQFGLFKYTAVIKRVSNMTKKGKMASYYALVIVGNPSKHLVGLASGKGLTAASAISSATHSATLSLSPVTLMSNRTFFGVGPELRSKWGSSTVIFRGRPAGFGLMVSPTLHPLFRAAGVRDASAEVVGSRNPMQALKAAIQLMHGGAGLPAFSPTRTTRSPRHNKRMGMRSVEEVERERGRFGVEVGRKI